MSDKKNKKCILLVRVSTESQSFEAQEKELFDLAVKDGYSKEQITPIAIKESAIKLKEEERLGLQKMYEYLATGEYDCVYAWEVSRIARTKKVLFSVQDKLVKNKIQLIIKNPSVRLLKDNGEIDAITSSTITSRAFLKAVNQAYAAYHSTLKDIAPAKCDGVSSATKKTVSCEQKPQTADEQKSKVVRPAAKKSDAKVSAVTRCNCRAVPTSCRNCRGATNCS